jgi:hypothetical protein
MGAPIQGFWLQRRLLQLSMEMQKIKDSHEQQKQRPGAR